jgi:hypothetical protein
MFAVQGIIPTRTSASDHKRLGTFFATIHLHLPDSHLLLAGI